MPSLYMSITLIRYPHPRYSGIHIETYAETCGVWFESGVQSGHNGGQNSLFVSCRNTHGLSAMHKRVFRLSKGYLHMEYTEPFLIFEQQISPQRSAVCLCV